MMVRFIRAIPRVRAFGHRNSALVFAGIAVAAVYSLAAGPHEHKPIEASRDSLDLQTALSRALERNAALAAMGFETQAREAGAVQASLGPNPELGIEAENFLGSGPLAGADGLETTVGVSQVIELGGKRSARHKVASAEKGMAAAEQAAARAGLEVAVRKAFTEVLAAQEQMRVLKQSLEVSEQILAAAQARHQAGKAPVTEAMKARMAYSLGHIEWDRLNQQWLSACTRLAAFWSEPKPSFGAARGDLRSLLPLAALDELLPRLKAHPELARMQAEIDHKKLSRELAQANRYPDMALSGGVRHLRDGGKGDVALVAGIALPLPLRNRNQGAVLESDYRLRKAEKELETVELGLAERLRLLHQSLTAKQEELGHLRDELLPEADKTLKASRYAYELGKLNFLEVLDSHRTLNELSTRYFTTLAEFQHDWNEMQALVAFGT